MDFGRFMTGFLVLTGIGTWYPVRITSPSIHLLCAPSGMAQTNTPHGYIRPTT